MESFRKDSKLTKTYDLKLLDINASDDKNPLIKIRNIYSDKDLINKAFSKIYDSPKKISGYRKKANTIINKDKVKIKNIINKKMINNILKNNLMLSNGKTYNSFSKIKLSDKLVLSDSGNTNENSKKRKEDKYKTTKIKINDQFKIIDLKNNTNINKFNLFLKSNRNLKNTFVINKGIEKLNNNNIYTQSLKQYTTTQSTLPGFSNILSPNKRSKRNICKSVSKKNESNYDISISKNECINDLKKFDLLIKYRKNYPFIINPNPLIPRDFNGLPRCVIKMNNRYENTLKRENEKVFRQYFSIIGKEKFSKKFQNITNKYEIKEKNFKTLNKVENDDESSNDNNSLINENIISGKKLLNEIKNDEKKHNNISEQMAKRILFNKFKKIMFMLQNKLIIMPIYLREILADYRKPKNSYGFYDTHDLFFAIKTKNYGLANSILDKHKCIVLDYDYFSMTALHWAAKYNFYQIIPKIVEYGSLVDKKNFIGDTPLFISVKHKYFESTVFLLLNFASPFEKDNKGLNIFDYCKNDFKLKSMIRKNISLHYNSFFIPTSKRYEYIIDRFVDFIIHENKGDLEIEAFNMVRDRYDYYKSKYKHYK
jgi:hypothetical protein